MKSIHQEKIIMIKDIILPIITIAVSIILAYLSTKWTINNQYRQGKYQFFEIVSRYFINAYNSIDITTVPPRTKLEPIDKIYQLEELRAIHQDISKLLDNPYYIELLKKFPEISMINIALRREIIDLEKATQVTLKPDNIDLFYKIYKNIKKGIPKRVFKNNKAYQEIDQIVESLNIGMEQFKTKNKIILPNDVYKK
jgi:hypothetical protein